MPASFPRLRDHLLDPSGGLVYHLRARLQRGRWAAFHAAVASWLDTWQVVEQELVIVGPNAGYALPDGFLGRFDGIFALEPDPLARRLLARRRDATTLRFDRLDCLRTPDGLAWLAARFPHAAFLFSNVLGQISAPAGDWSTLLRHHLAGRTWASYHDVISTLATPGCRDALTIMEAESLETTLARFWPGQALTVTDHATFHLGGTGPFAYAPWPIAGARWHLVEWVAHRAQDQAQVLTRLPDDACPSATLR
ncbi:MAG: hypothetical protein JSR83_21400 [Proteobacteria bacterium]|nr:hypothetical protein [Pseudomonadota bacterium]